METGSTLVRVTPRHDGGWEVREPGNRQPLAREDSEAGALRRARASLTRGGVVQILDRDGFLLATEQVPAPADQPWWYLPRRGLFWVFGLSFSVQGLLRLVLDRDPLVLTVGYLALGPLALVPPVLSRRRDRRAGPTSTPKAS